MKTSTPRILPFYMAILSCLYFLVLFLPDTALAQFQRNYGTALDDSYSKVIVDGNSFYVLGQTEPSQGALHRATVTRLDAAGLHQWTLSLDIASVWNDAVLTTNGDLLVVGATLPFDPTTKSLMGVVTSSGSFSCLRSYDEPGRDFFFRVVKNPAPENPAFPYYILGSQNQAGATATTEDVVLANVDANCNFNWKKVYNSILDDEFFRDLDALSNGDLLLAGNNEQNQGLIYKTDNTGTVINGVQISQLSFVDLGLESAGGFYAAANSIPAGDAHILKFDQDLILQWDVVIPELASVRQIWEGMAGKGIATGKGDFDGASRDVIIKILDSGPTIAWAKYFSAGSGFTGGSAWSLPNMGLAFTDSRVLNNGFGGDCAFISVSDLDLLEACLVTESSVTLQIVEPLPEGPVFPPVDFWDAPMGVNLTFSAIDWLEAEVCNNDPCAIELDVTFVDNCGHIQVNSVVTGPPPYTYQWCSGETSANIDVQLPCGPHTFCVTVTCGDGSSATASESIVVSDNIPPTPVCVPPFGVDLDANCQFNVTPAMIDGGSFDNCQVQSMSVSPQVLTGCGVFPITLTVEDWCGNTSTCTTEIQTIEVVPPLMTCPADLTLHCDDDLDPSSTGFPTVSDNCDPNPVVTYSDVISGQMPCDGLLQRTWTATDSCGNIATCVQNILVFDNEAPMITCPADMTISSPSTPPCQMVVNGIQWLSATDNCGTPVITYQVSGATTLSGSGDASGQTFNQGVSTVTYTAADECGNAASCSFMVTVECGDSCPGNMIQNGDFLNGAIAGPMPSPGMVNNWQVGFGNPEVFTDFGCGDPNYIRLEGNITSGSTIYQTLSTPIVKGKVYELSVCIRYAVPCPGYPYCVPYVKLRGMAFNNSLPQTGTHPEPNSDLAIIDISGRIPYCTDWTQFVFHRWRAGKNYDNIAISVENSENPSSGLISIADIDNICLIEVNDSIPCYLAEFDSLGNLIPPFGLIDPACPPLEEEVDIYMGSVNDLYGYCDSTALGIDTWYDSCPDSCQSIGGEIPAELDEFIDNDSLNQYLMDSLGVADSILINDLNNFLDSLELANPNPNMLDSMTSLGAWAFNCRSLPPQGPPPNDPDSPFNGRDIVFVHGLRTDPLIERMLGDPDAQTTWPADRNEFYNGYWKKGAYRTWNSHTLQYLKTQVDPGSLAVIQNGTYSNRYLVVAHPATQSFAVGAHAVMEQIANAMIDGTGVINCDPGETRPKNTFGHNGFIIISHSDGGPLTDISLTTSNLTQYPPLNFMLGDVSFIAERCELHVALQGAFGGSNYAPLALMAATTGVQYVSPIVEPYLGGSISGPTGWLFTSQLLDMAITKHLWGWFINEVPVCVLTLAGGHSTDYGEGDTHKKWLSFIGKHAIHHGFDDGVLSMESQTANPDPRKTYPNVFLPPPGLLGKIKLYDMGIPTERGIRYYLDQKTDIKVAGNPLKIPYASAACIPWLSPTGMVQPVVISRIPGVPGFDALKRYNNHYSFLQSAADHYQGSKGPFPNYPDYEKTYDTGSRNYEESRVITSTDVYTKCGVSYPKIGNSQVEYIRGKKITFSLPWPIKKTYTYWVWKRKYHVLSGYETKNQLDYLYDSVLK